MSGGASQSLEGLASFEWISTIALWIQQDPTENFPWRTGNGIIGLRLSAVLALFVNVEFGVELQLLAKYTSGD